MAYRNDYSFIHHYHKNGEKTRWYSVYTYLKENGPAKRREIIKAVWDREPHDFTYIYNWCGREHKNNTMRGWQSNLFGQLNSAGVCIYNTKTKKWEAGELPLA